MELSEAIGNVRRMGNVFKSFSKIEEVMRFLSEIEVFERDAKEKITALKSDHAKAQEELQVVTEKLLSKRNSVNQEIGKIDSNILEEKDKRYTELNVEMYKVEDAISQLKKVRDAEAENIKELKGEKGILENDVKSLRKVISDIQAVKGVE